MRSIIVRIKSFMLVGLGWNLGLPDCVSLLGMLISHCRPQFLYLQKRKIVLFIALGAKCVNTQIILRTVQACCPLCSSWKVRLGQGL